MSIVRKRVVARGRVQGVFFRDSTRGAAESRGVAGWARNDPNGSVTLAFEGEPEAVEAMVQFVRECPGSSDVREVEVSDEEPEGASGFSVR